MVDAAGAVPLAWAAAAFPSGPAVFALAGPAQDWLRYHRTESRAVPHLLQYPYRPLVGAGTEVAWRCSNYLLQEAAGCELGLQRQPGELEIAACGAARRRSSTMSGPRLRFCRESNDLLYPREDKATKRLIYYCKNCNYVEDAEKVDWCVYRNAIKEVKDKTVVTQVKAHEQPSCPETRVACRYQEHYPTICLQAMLQRLFPILNLP